MATQTMEHYIVPTFFSKSNIDHIYNDRGPMAARDPYVWREYGAPAGYKIRTRNPYTYAYVGATADSFRKQAKFNRVGRIVLQFLGVALLVAAIAGILTLICGVTVPARAEEADIGFPSFWQHDATLVRSVQEALVRYGETVEVDGKFGKDTGAAVKRLQKRYSLTVTGVVDDNFAWSFQVENWPYDRGYTLYYMANLQLIYNHSDYEDLIYVSLGGRGYDPNNAEVTGSHLWLFRDGVLIADSPCITGNEEKGYFTPLGARKICGRKASASGRYSNYYWLLHLNERIYIQSYLDYFDETRNSQVPGAHQSDGCIRVPEDFAEWLYKNEPNGVTVVVDDRAYFPYNAPGYEHLLDEEPEDWEYYETDYYDGVG